jgi:hypothetical protein
MQIAGTMAARSARLTACGRCGKRGDCLGVFHTFHKALMFARMETLCGVGACPRCYSPLRQSRRSNTRCSDAPCQRSSHVCQTSWFGTDIFEIRVSSARALENGALCSLVAHRDSANLASLSATTQRTPVTLVVATGCAQYDQATPSMRSRRQRDQERNSAGGAILRSAPRSQLRLPRPSACVSFRGAEETSR